MLVERAIKGRGAGLNRAGRFEREEREAVDDGWGGLEALMATAAPVTEVLADTSRVGSNGGTLAGLVGSHEQVAERIAVFHDAGIELFMLQFQPLEAELHRFAEHIIPRFR